MKKGDLDRLDNEYNLNYLAAIIVINFVNK